MVTQVPVLDPTKLTRARGNRTRAEVVKAAGDRFSEQQLYAYEKGLYRPKPETVPYLLEALGVDFEEVSSPLTSEVEVEQSVVGAR